MHNTSWSMCCWPFSMLFTDHLATMHMGSRVSGCFSTAHSQAYVMGPTCSVLSQEGPPCGALMCLQMHGSVLAGSREPA